MMEYGSLRPRPICNEAGLPRRKRELFDLMSIRSPIPIHASAARKSVLSTKPKAQSQCSSWRQVSRPCALGIVGLAIAVFLWGYGYKLSLYHRHSEPSTQVSVAKLWIEYRSTAAVAASRLRARPHSIAGSLEFAVPVQYHLWLSRILFCIFLASIGFFASFDLLIPSRAPPPHRFWLV